MAHTSLSFSRTSAACPAADLAVFLAALQLAAMVCRLLANNILGVGQSGGKGAATTAKAAAAIRGRAIQFAKDCLRYVISSVATFGGWQVHLCSSMHACMHGHYCAC